MIINLVIRLPEDVQPQDLEAEDAALLFFLEERNIKAEIVEVSVYQERELPWLQEALARIPYDHQ